MRKWAIGLLAALSVFVMNTTGASLEGRYLPAVDSPSIDRVFPDPNGGVLVWLSYDSARNCDLNRIEWRLGLTRYAVVDVFYPEPSTVTRVGTRVHVGPLRVHLAPEQLEEASHAAVYSRCHPLWETETVVHAPTQM